MSKKRIKLVMNNKKLGFTLMELLIVMAILMILVVILIGIINPISLVGKANDSRRKKDLDAIRKSFEEYFNDKGAYPIDIGNWNIKTNCKSSVFNSYLNPWPCDPNGNPYYIWVSNDGKYFKVLTNLENKTDMSIPSGWYNQNGSYEVNGYSTDEVNYGVSSPNISWYTRVESVCSPNCYQLSAGGKCNSAVGGCDNANGLSCYNDSDCNSSCEVACCGAGCN